MWLAPKRVLASLPCFVLCVARLALISVKKGLIVVYMPILLFEGGQCKTNLLCSVFHGSHSNNHKHIWLAGNILYFCSKDVYRPVFPNRWVVTHFWVAGPLFWVTKSGNLKNGCQLSFILYITKG